MSIIKIINPGYYNVIKMDYVMLSFLYSYFMDKMINSYLRKDGKIKNLLIEFKKFLTNDCQKIILESHFIPKLKLNYCECFDLFLQKISLFTKYKNVNINNFENVIIPFYYETMKNLSLNFVISKNTFLYRTIILSKNEKLKKDVGFISTALNPLPTLYTFGYLQKEDENNLFEKDDVTIYFFKIFVEAGTNCIPISILGTIDKEEQEILFTDNYTMIIEKIETKKEFPYNCKKINDKSFCKFIQKNLQNIKFVTANLVLNK